MTAIKGAAAAVTGAASGIGRALAIEFAARGAELALADRDEAGLASVAAEIGSKAKVSKHRVDGGEPAQIAGFVREAIAAHPALNIVVNNAGVALLGQFHEIDQAQMEWLFNINFWGRGAFDPRLPAASCDEAGGPHRQRLLDLRHRRPARSSRLCGGEIRPARLFRKPAP